MKFFFRAALVSVFLIFPMQLASAQDVHPCRADREKFCPGIERGDPKLFECMKQHEAELSTACKEEREAWQKVRATCKGDEEKFCAEAGKERGAAVKCLMGHENEVTPPCADALKTRPRANKS
jgi:hypothetical protein